jgi:hypothetical protein
VKHQKPVEGRSCKNYFLIPPCLSYGQTIEFKFLFSMLSLRHDQKLRLSLFNFTSLAPTTGNFPDDVSFACIKI